MTTAAQTAPDPPPEEIPAPEPPPITPEPPPPPTPLAATMFESEVITGGEVNTGVETGQVVSILGNTHPDAMVFTQPNWNSRIQTRHNLGGQYTRLTGIIGRIDGTGAQQVTYTFTGDGRTLVEHTINATDAPVNIDIDVSGITLLIIQVRSIAHHSTESAVVGTLHR